MTLVILAAGLGSRYGGLKQLEPINKYGEFIIDYSVFDAKRAGFDRVVFVIKEENYNAFRETIGRRIEGHIKVEYAFQKIEDIPSWAEIPEGRTKPWGTTQALLAARDIVDDNFAVCNADDFYGTDTFAKVASHLKRTDLDKPVPQYCMVGFLINNTLSENGSVSRGICETYKGMLNNIVERTKVYKTPAGPAYLDEGREVLLPDDTVVSMNFWGFTPAVFPQLESCFHEFLRDLKNSENPQKAEALLPTDVGKLLHRGECSVRVYSTDSVWFGVTYHEDREGVMKNIDELTDGVRYPRGLWI
ncbi:MAG: NTP transferase domain-containing protein [Clostridiales bacterium]|nr:NTP transferase domain-containing protein [Clostridiales bacterium]